VGCSQVDELSASPGKPSLLSLVGPLPCVKFIARGVKDFRPGAFVPCLAPLRFRKFSKPLRFAANSAKKEIKQLVL
jgi:hypothetical protein